MQHITQSSFVQLRLWPGLVIVSLLILTAVGQPLDSQYGWFACPPHLPSLPIVVVRRKKLQSGLSLSHRLHLVWRYAAHSWPQPILRSCLLALFWSLSGYQGPASLLLWPWLLWLWQVGAAACPEWGQTALWCGGYWLLWQGQRLLLLGYLGLALHRIRPAEAETDAGHPPVPCLFLGLSCPHCGHEEPWIDVIHTADGGYQATVCGHYVIQVPGDHPFRARMLLLFLSWLDVPDHHRRSRRARGGRAPFVRQRQLAEWFRLSQPVVSRIMGYWHQGAWPELLSQNTPEILTTDLIRRIVTVCATFPHWGQEEVWCYLHDQEVAVSRHQVRQAMEQSGWSLLRQELTHHYQWTPKDIHLKEEWLVQELLRLSQFLLKCLETGQALPNEERIALADVQALAREAGLETSPPLKAVPWLLRVERVVLGNWQIAEDDTLRCPECHSTHIVRKSRKPRLKKFYDAEGKRQEVPVYRYYCRNQACPRGSFTHLPPGLVPYSRHRLEVHLLAWQAYAWSYSTYRRVGQALQVSEATIYRWVSAWGQQLLPVAAIFGAVRSSGVVGVDEKFVLVPKNDKPEGKMRRWMYAYMAVDIHTYDLLHIAIYPHNTRPSAQAFLSALRTKGYKPKLIVTDLRRDYGPVIAEVFPKAHHHECIFHAEQEISRYLAKTWDRDYADRHPQVEEVRTGVVKIFQAQTKRTAQKRYQALLDQQERYVQGEPNLQWVFDFLEQHWSSLVSSVENGLVPATNNATEMVIRRFDQHYQNFCGFESIESAQLYIGVFEKLYRFTPFSKDAQPRIRGKSPLQLAGYDLSQMPMTWLCRGYSLVWPVTSEDVDVPNP